MKSMEDTTLTEDFIHQCFEGRELDCLISKYVFNNPSLGLAICSNTESGWWVYLENDLDDCTSVKQPIRLRDIYGCQCSVYEKLKRDVKNEEIASGMYPVICGHHRGCLEVVPFYSTNISDAWTIVDYLTKSLDEIIKEDKISYGNWTLDRLGYDCCKDNTVDTDGVHGEWRCSMNCDKTEDEGIIKFSTGKSPPLCICKTALLVALEKNEDRIS